MTIVQLDDFRIELSQPLKDRPDVIVITASDGRRAILGDGMDLFTVDEYRQIDRLNCLDGRGQRDSQLGAD